MTVIAIVGPTASGKSALAVRVCLALDGEVVNADSMQLYRGMDIGTAKLPNEQRQGVAHHLLDIYSPSEQVSVAEYQKLARATVADIEARHKVAVLVGGSGLFVQAVLDDLQFPGTDELLRAALEERLAAEGAKALYAELQAADPQAAAAILPTNGRRIVRALEVLELTGTAPTTTLTELPEVIPARRIGLEVERTSVDRRIDERVEQMWAAGLVAEVRNLRAGGLSRTAQQAIGYRQVLAHLAGECSLDEAKAATKLATRRYVRRQQSWFKRDSRIQWFAADAPDLLARVLSAYRA